MLDQNSIATLREHNEEKLRQKVDEKEQELLSRYVEPHNVVSRSVFSEDIFTIEKEAEVMYKLLFCRRGKHQGAYALAHAQIESKTPLRFFVTHYAVVINPVIIRHTEHGHVKKEGCLTFPDHDPAIVKRFNKCEVEFQTIIKHKDGSLGLSDVVKKSIKGLEAEVWQHEIDHMNAKYIYEDIF